MAGRFAILTGKTNGARWVQGEVSWAGLLAKLRKPATRKDCGGYVPGDFGGDGPRTRARCVSRSIITLDYDADAPADLPARVEELGCRGALHPTYSSTDEEPRWRVVLPLAAPIPAADYRAAVDAVVADLGTDGLDPRSRMPEQFMYWPARPAGEPYELIELDGEPLDPDLLLAAPIDDLPDNPDRLPPTPDIVRGVAEGHRDDHLYRLACRLVGEGMAPADVEAVVLTAAARSGFPEAEALKCVRSAERYREAPVDAAGVLARLARLDLAELLNPNRPPREWVAEPLLPAGVSVALVAPAGQKKSLLCLRLAVALALGEPMLAGITIPRARRVLYVDQELTEDDWIERLTSFGITQADAPRLGELVPLLLPDLPPLDTKEGGALLVAAVEAYGLGPGDLVVLDSFQRVTVGKENDSDTARAFYEHTGKRLKKLGLTVLRTDNTGKDIGRGARGTAGKRDDVDAELLLTAVGDELRINLGSKIRQRGAPELVVRLVQHDDGRTTFEAVDGRPRADVLSAIDAALADGQWHSTNTVFKAVRADGVKAKDGVLRAALRWCESAGRTQSRTGANRSLEYQQVRPAAAEDFDDDLL